jgi:hypothetical protein
MNEIKYLSQFLFLKEKDNKSKNELNANIFLDYWINKYSPFHAREFSNIIKSYSDSENPNKKYNELLNFYENEFKKQGYDISSFDVIFESFFPKPFDLTDDKKMILEFMMKQIDKNKNNIKNKINNSSMNNELKKMHMDTNILNNLNIKIDDQRDDIYILFFISNVQILKFNWGTKTLFNSLLNKLNFKIEDFQSIFQNIQPIETINYNFTNLYFNNSLKEIKDIYHFFNNYITSEKNFNIDDKHNKELYLILSKIDKKNIIQNNDDYIDNKYLLKNYEELFDLKFLFYIYKYIHNNINQFIEFDNNILIKIKKLYEIFLNEINNIRNHELSYLFIDTFKKKTEINYLLGKDNYKEPFGGTKQVLQILKLFNIVFDLQLKISISNQDLLLSLLFHQYDYSIITNDNNNYFIRRDIDNYYLIKNYILTNLNLNNIDLINYNKIKYNIPFVLSNNLFLDIEYEMKIPFDLIFKDKSLIINEKINSGYKSTDKYLDNISLNKNLIILNNQNNKKLENYYIKLDILKNEELNIDIEKENVDLDKFIKSLKGGKKIKQKKIKLMNSLTLNLNKDNYYNIYEEKFLNPIQDFKPSKYAYCSLYYGNNQYFLDTMLFGYSLYLSGTKSDRILICTTDVILEQRKQLSRFYNRIFFVKPLDIDPLYFKSENRWYGVFNKLYAFYLDEYEKIFLMDTDMIIQKSEKINKLNSYNNLDLMFEKLNTPCGMCYDKEYILKTNEKIPERLIEKYLYENKTIVSAGVYLIKPSKEVFMDIVQRTNPNLNKNIKSKIRGSYFPEEAFLAEYFKKDGIYTLGAQYSFTPMWLDISNDKLGVKRLLESIKEEDIVVVHYVGYKNWSYLISPYWFLFEKNEINNKIEKYKKLWCLLFMNLEKLCTKKTYGIECIPLNSLINYCKWDKIGFGN